MLPLITRAFIIHVKNHCWVAPKSKMWNKHSNQKFQRWIRWGLWSASLFHQDPTSASGTVVLKKGIARLEQWKLFYFLIGATDSFGIYSRHGLSSLSHKRSFIKMSISWLFFICVHWSCRLQPLSFCQTRATTQAGPPWRLQAHRQETDSKAAKDTALISAAFRPPCGKIFFYFTQHSPWLLYSVWPCRISEASSTYQPCFAGLRCLIVYKWKSAGQIRVYPLHRRGRGLLKLCE